jgi:hypothetical protein
MLDHEASERGNNGHGLDVEISKHLIGFPTAQETNSVRIDVRAKERHGATGPQ